MLDAPLISNGACASNSGYTQINISIDMYAGRANGKISEMASPNKPRICGVENAEMNWCKH